MKVIQFCWLLLFLLFLAWPIIAQQEIEVIDNVAFKKGKIEKVNIVYHENNCIDVWLKYIGDCADQLDIYIDSIFFESKYIPEGSRLDQPYVFSITGLKGDEDIQVLVNFIDCTEPEPVLVQPPVIMQSRDPCEPCLADCDRYGFYFFSKHHHNGWLQRTSIPMDKTTFGIGLKTDLGSDSLVIIKTEFSPLSSQWVLYFLEYTSHYTTADIEIATDVGFSFLRIYGIYHIGFHYENSDIDSYDYTIGLLLKLNRFKLDASYQSNHLNFAYPYRPTDGFNNSANAILTYRFIEEEKHKLDFGPMIMINKFKDRWYEILHKPIYPGIYLEYDFCSYPFNVNTKISWEKGDQSEHYKIENFIIDPPVNLFWVTFSFKYLF